MSAPTDATPLGEARDWLRDELMPEGEFSTTATATCPCCRRMTKIYRRHIHAEMARGLILAYRLGAADDFVHVSREIPGYQNTDFARFAHWQLAVEAPNRTEDGNRPGWWRLTAHGLEFVLSRRTVDRYVWIYADRPLRFEGGPWSIRHALESKFDYAELMGLELSELVA